MVSRRDLLRLSATDHLIVKAILGRRFDWGRRSPID
jgi:hypothetical protein